MANFQTALDALKRGEKVARKGWKNGFLFLACGIDFYTTADLGNVYEKIGGQCDGETDALWHYDCGPAWNREAICFCPKNRGRGELSVGWLPKFDDLFADDWYICDDKPYCTREEVKKKIYEAPKAEVKTVDNNADKTVSKTYSGEISSEEALDWAWLIRKLLSL